MSSAWTCGRGGPAEGQRRVVARSLSEKERKRKRTHLVLEVAQDLAPLALDLVEPTQRVAHLADPALRLLLLLGAIIVEQVPLCARAANRLGVRPLERVPAQVGQHADVPAHLVPQRARLLVRAPRRVEALAVRAQVGAERARAARRRRLGPQVAVPRAQRLALARLGVERRHDAVERARRAVALRREAAERLVGARRRRGLAGADLVGPAADLRARVGERRLGCGARLEPGERGREAHVLEGRREFLVGELGALGLGAHELGLLLRVERRRLVHRQRDEPRKEVGPDNLLHVGRRVHVVDRDRLGDGLALVDGGERRLGGDDLVVDDVVVLLGLGSRLGDEREVRLGELGERDGRVGRERGRRRRRRERGRERLRQAVRLLGGRLGDLEPRERLAVLARRIVGDRAVVLGERRKVLGLGLQGGSPSQLVRFVGRERGSEGGGDGPG